jgi:hypothetical protein
MIRKGKVYKVWVEIEEYDVAEGHGENSGAALSIPCTATFKTEGEAVALAEKMHAAFENAPGQVQHL